MFLLTIGLHCFVSQRIRELLEDFHRVETNAVVCNLQVVVDLKPLVFALGFCY